MKNNFHEHSFLIGILLWIEYIIPSFTIYNYLFNLQSMYNSVYFVRYYVDSITFH